MTPRRYLIALAIAFLIPWVVLYGGMLVVGFMPTLGGKLTDWLTKGLREYVAEDESDD